MNENRIDKVMRTALRAITQLEPDVKKTFKLERQVRAVSGKVPKNIVEYTIWDKEIRSAGHAIAVRIFLPPKPETNDVLLYFHGGGWVLGNIDSYSRTCANLAKHTRRTVMSVDYRLAPEHPFPAAPEDCYAVAREIFSGSILGARPDQVTLIGDSAGANLAAVVSLMARERGDFHPLRQILLYPVTHYDHGENSPFPSILENGTDYLLTAKRIRDMLDLYAGKEEDRQNPYFAPLLEEDLTDQPRTLLITAQYDPLRDEGECYGERLLESGNDVTMYRMPDALHGFIALPPLFPHVKKTYELINRFLER